MGHNKLPKLIEVYVILQWVWWSTVMCQIGEECKRHLQACCLKGSCTLSSKDQDQMRGKGKHSTKLYYWKPSRPQSQVRIKSPQKCVASKKFYSAVLVRLHAKERKKKKPSSTRAAKNLEHLMLLFTYKHAHTHTTPSLQAMHCPIHFSLHHSKQYCLWPRVLTLKQLELLTSGRPLHPFGLCYRKAEK